VLRYMPHRQQPRRSHPWCSYPQGRLTSAAEHAQIKRLYMTSHIVASATWWRLPAHTLLLGTLACLCHLLHGRLESAAAIAGQRSGPAAREVLPSAAAARLLSLGYVQLMADHYYLKAVHHFGDRRMHALNYPNLANYLQHAVALDPYFVSAYLLGGTALTVQGLNPQDSVDLLAQGCVARPDVWRIAFFYGFNAFYFLGDNRRAAAALAKAALAPDAPAYVGELSARLAVAAKLPELGLQFIDAMLQAKPDADTRAVYQARRQSVLLEVILQQLQRAAVAYRQQQGRPLQKLQQLREAGLVETLPPDPLGGEFLVDATGDVQTLHQAERLQLHAGAQASP
jgi:hypothetical protein